eukprot:gene14052-18845_t
MEHSSIDLKLKRLDRVYKPRETVEGVVTVNCLKGWSHSGIKMVVEGLIHLMHANRGIGGLTTDGNSRPVRIMEHHIDVCPSGKFADGIIEIPFDFPATPLEGHTLLESYHGVYISVIYNISVTCERGMLKKALYKELEFIIEIPQVTNSVDPLPVPFDISPDKLENISSTVLATIPKFKLVGKLHKSKCPINQPLTGEVIIELSVAPIRSLELQLVRVESVNIDGMATKEATEIQNIQIGEGNICRNIVVPMYMVFPRLFSCPTVISSVFKIEFEMNLIVVFGDGYMITENFPIVLYREG